MTAVETSTHSLLLTPPGTGAIAVIRVVGPNAVSIVNAIFRGRTATPLKPDGSNSLRYGSIFDGDEELDEVIASVNSANGSAINVDVCCHGGVRVVERILSLLAQRGAPLLKHGPNPIPFERHANRIEAEADEGLGRAKTGRAVEFLAWQRAHLAPALERLLESPIDSLSVSHELSGMAARFNAARALIDGVRIALIGPPNSGKSTLFNRFIGRSAAIVSPHPGTTRDWVAEEVEIGGLPVTLIDTAGIHESSDALERVAIAAGQHITGTTNLCLLVFDISQPCPSNVPRFDRLLPHGPPPLLVCNKIDAAPEWKRSSLSAAFAPRTVEISAQTGQGLPSLADRIKEAFGVETLVESTPTLFSQRQFAIAQSLSAQGSPLTTEDVMMAIRKLIGASDDPTR